MTAKACKKDGGIWDSGKKVCFRFYKNVSSKDKAKDLVNKLTYVYFGTAGGKYRKAKEGYDVYQLYRGEP
ncbi:MAG: hypothetical protein KAW47_10825 [Thermoplasmatales archaeon]|nr:hypothetical protein [Thermoplasmatales archaeon]